MYNIQCYKRFLLHHVKSALIFGVFLKFLEQQVLVQEISTGHKLKTLLKLLNNSSR